MRLTVILGVSPRIIKMAPVVRVLERAAITLYAISRLAKKTSSK